MYPTLHIYLQRLSPLVCLQHLSCFPFFGHSRQCRLCEVNYIFFSYFTHIFVHLSHFPLLPLLSMPSIIRCVTNYLSIIFHTDVQSEGSLFYDRVYYVAIVLYVRHVGFFFFWGGGAQTNKKKMESKAPPVVLEYTGTIDCFRLRGVRTSTIPITVQIAANCTARKANKSNCGRQCANRQTKFR